MMERRIDGKDSVFDAVMKKIPEQFKSALEKIEREELNKKIRFAIQQFVEKKIAGLKKSKLLQVGDLPRVIKTTDAEVEIEFPVFIGIEEQILERFCKGNILRVVSISNEKDSEPNRPVCITFALTETGMATALGGITLILGLEKELRGKVDTYKVLKEAGVDILG